MSDSTAPAAPAPEAARPVRGGRTGALARWLWARGHPAVVLPVLVVGVFLLRYLTLLEIPYPPSGDAAGDLVWLHTYLGHPLPGYTIVEAPPPVYIFLVVYPATAGLGIFTGIRFIMAFIPALIAIPGYFLLRELRCGVVSAYGGATVLATSAALSSMVSWNSAFNATGILFLVGFLVLLVRGLRTRDRASLIGAAVLLALVAGTHIVTFLYTLAALAAFAIELVLVDGRAARAALGFLGKMGALAAVFSIPFVPAYYYSYTITANVGPPSQESGFLQLLYTYSQSLSLPWGSNDPVSTPDLLGTITLLDMFLTIAVLYWVWARPALRDAALLSSALFFAAIFIAALDPGNSVRAVYFLPIAYVPALAPVASHWSWPAPSARAVAAPASTRRWRSGSVGRVGGIAVAGVAFLVANAIVSQQVLAQSEQYYELLSPDKIAALDWIDAHTAGNATFYDGANLQTWLPGYAHRLSYAPTPLDSRVTTISYDRAFEANLIDLGGYVIGDSQLYVTSNAPGVYNSPGIFLRTSDFSMPIWLGQSDTTYVEVGTPSGPRTVLLDYGEQIAANGSVLANGTAELTLRYAFPPAGLVLFENLSVTGPTVRFGFTSPEGPVENVTVTMRTPPSGYYYDYAPYAAAPAVGVLSESLAVPYIGVVDYRLAASGLRAVADTESTGWSSVNVSSPDGWTLTLSGWGGSPGEPPFYESTLGLARELGISYFVISTASDYPLFERYFALETQGYLTMPIVYASGTIQIFQLS